VDDSLRALWDREPPLLKTDPGIIAFADKFRWTVKDPAGASVEAGTTRNLAKFPLTREGTYTFTVVPAGTYKVTANLGGFSAGTRDVTVPGTGTVQVPAMTLKVAVHGEEVVVTATRAETSLVNAPATMTVIGNDVIETSPAQNRRPPAQRARPQRHPDVGARRHMTAPGTSTPSNSQPPSSTAGPSTSTFGSSWDFVPTNPRRSSRSKRVAPPRRLGANALTGVINIITRRRASRGHDLTSPAAASRATRADGQRRGRGGEAGYHAGAPNDTWSYRLTALPKSDADCAQRLRSGRSRNDRTQVGHPPDPSFKTGCGVYPPDRGALARRPRPRTGAPASPVRRTPDQSCTTAGASPTAAATRHEGIVHTASVPLTADGSYPAYGRVAYVKSGLKVAAFGNFLDGDAPNLLSVDARTGQPLQLTFKTQTYDFEVGNTNVIGGNNILTYGGNARRNAFDLSIAPNAEDRNEFGAYVQDEIFFGQFRFNVGGRVDKFGNIDKAVFSPRVTAMFKPLQSHAFRLSFNRAFRSPSAINNFLDVATVTGVFPLGAVDPRLGAATFPVVTRSVGSNVTQIGEPNGHDLKEESLTAYEIGYTGTFANKTTVGLAYYINDTDDNINFITDLCRKRHTASNPPPAGRCRRWCWSCCSRRAASACPRVHLLNLGKLRNQGSRPPSTTASTAR
jgi:outer membrane receptor protein involved in Fe transport